MEDEYGVPDSFFGTPFAAFYPTLGRIVSVSALLELAVLNLYGALTQEPESRTAGKAVAELLQSIRKFAARTSPDAMYLTPGTLARVEDLASHAQGLMVRRNAYVHGLFPDATPERVFGWRPARKAHRDSEATTVATLETSADEMQQLLEDLVACVVDFGQCLSLVQRPHGAK